MKGYYRDHLLDKAKHLQHDCGWRSNRIVNDCNTLLAALMKGSEGLGGVLYLAVGEGLRAWDRDIPQPSPTTSQLTHELVRRVLDTSDITFLDNNNLPTPTPTSRLEIRCQLTREDFAENGFQSLREFALFGGDATAEANSGFMINHVIHPRIDITEGITLARTLRLDFSQGAVQMQEISTFGATLPVQSIDGVGETYATSLNAIGVQSLGDLAVVNPLLPVANISTVKLREFRAKALMVLGFSANISAFAELAHYSISDLLKENPQVLTSLVHETVATPEMIADFQEELMPLQVALDDRQLKSMKLGDLLNF